MSKKDYRHSMLRRNSSELITKAKCKEYFNFHLQWHLINGLSFAFVPPGSSQHTIHLATYVYSKEFSKERKIKETSKKTIDALYEALRIRSYGQATSQLPALVNEVLVQSSAGLETLKVKPICVCFQKKRVSQAGSVLNKLEDYFQCFKVELDDDGNWKDEDDVAAEIAAALTPPI
jgi:hypothetical protein